MAWWLWLLLGLVLAALELASTGGFYLIFFGVSAMFIGLMGAIGLAGPRGCSGSSSRSSA